MAHNITFGMLLGYPGEAISSGLYELDGAWPVYDYLKDVANSQHIKRHEKLWSDILTGVYARFEPEIIKPMIIAWTYLYLIASASAYSAPHPLLDGRLLISADGWH